MYIYIVYVNHKAAQMSSSRTQKNCCHRVMYPRCWDKQGEGQNRGRGEPESHLSFSTSMPYFVLRISICSRFSSLFIFLNACREGGECHIYQYIHKCYIITTKAFILSWCKLLWITEGVSILHVPYVVDSTVLRDICCTRWILKGVHRHSWHQRCPRTQQTQFLVC